MKDFLLKHFLEHTPEHLLYPGPQFTQENTVVNYLWVDAAPWKSSGPGDAQCGVRLSAIDKAYENARKYPDAQVLMWIDFSRMDAKAQRCVQQHYADNAPDNVTLKDLSTLADYRQASVALPETDHSKTRRPDLARLYVMRDCLRTMPEKTYVMYCDLDVEDVRIGCPKSQRILGRHGMVHTYVTSLNKPEKGKFLGLGYMIFRRDMAGPFLAELIPTAERHMLKDGHPGICGALTLALIDWQSAGPYRSENDVIHPDTLLHPVGYIAPENPVYEALGMNY
jgi:hypothetical protein